MSFEIEIISQNGLEFTGDVDSVTLPGTVSYTHLTLPTSDLV